MDADKVQAVSECKTGRTRRRRTCSGRAAIVIEDRGLTRDALGHISFAYAFLLKPCFRDKHCVHVASMPPCRVYLVSYLSTTP